MDALRLKAPSGTLLGPRHMTAIIVAPCRLRSSPAHRCTAHRHAVLKRRHVALAGACDPRIVRATLILSPACTLWSAAYRHARPRRYRYALGDRMHAGGAAKRAVRVQLGAPGERCGADHHAGHAHVAGAWLPGVPPYQGGLKGGAQAWATGRADTQTGSRAAAKVQPEQGGMGASRCVQLQGAQGAGAGRSRKEWAPIDRRSDVWCATCRTPDTPSIGVRTGTHGSCPACMYFLQSL